MNTLKLPQWPGYVGKQQKGLVSIHRLTLPLVSSSRSAPANCRGRHPAQSWHTHPPFQTCNTRCSCRLETRCTSSRSKSTETVCSPLCTLSRRWPCKTSPKSKSVRCRNKRYKPRGSLPCSKLRPRLFPGSCSRDRHDRPPCNWGKLKSLF